ncbi:UNVERIFIED_CONTAM: Lysosomal Pro-X carboxypeptidase [Sesamum radiatum]|uniref:Lysosomal Pro-X carboxypeptidase n=1 Tax=Sesamum radiatum TaxID=300843 RepID=A0AAW2V6Q0_SESRA
MANFPKPKANLSLLISLFLFFFSQTISSLPLPRPRPRPRPRPSGLLSPQHAPRFLGKFSHSNNTGRLGAPRYRYETRYFDQNLDHFSFSDLPTFRQRYLINTEYWAGPDKLGPIFLYCGNEGDIEWFAANTGFVWELAPRFRAMIIFPEVCKKIDNCPDGTSIIQRIFEGVSVYYNYTGKVNCFNLEDDPHGMNGWNWQACTEMVMPTSSSKSASMFPAYDLTYFMKGFKHALKNFGSNIIFSNGLLDPWSGGSVLEDISETIVALVTEKGAHHLDLRPATAEDPDWLVEQRAAEAKLIQGWLDEYFERKRRVFDM